MAVEKKVVFKSKWLPWVLVAPQVFIISAFFFWPAAQAFIQSVQEIEYTKDAMAQMYEPLRALATNEDLPAHAEALAARLAD